MVRKYLIAGNWKMNLDGQQAVDLATALAARFARTGPVDIAVFPPSIYLQSVATAVQSSAVAWGVQNMWPEANGAFTGELSASMLVDTGCQYVILGHSERRTLMGETDTAVNAKARAALASGLIPIVCLGETLEQREAGQTDEVVSQQFAGSLAEISPANIHNVVIAYEPVWAIGTGQVATGEQAQAVHADLRKMLENQYNPELADQVRILYGGSVKPDNAGDLLGRADIDGALVGGASLQADSFSGIIAAAQSLATS